MARSARVTFAELNLPLGTTFTWDEFPSGGSTATGSCTDSTSGPRRARVTWAELVYPDRGEIVYTETPTGGVHASGSVVDAIGGPRGARVTWAALEFAAREPIVYNEHPGFPFGFPPWDVPAGSRSGGAAHDRASLVTLGICDADDRAAAFADAADYVRTVWTA